MQKPIKSLGQNFLQNEKIADNMINALNIGQNDIIVEIGGGQGALTEKLIKKSFKHLYVYEIDSNLISNLKSLVKGHENVTIICESILDVDFESFETNGNLKVIGSIPYYITSPIIHRILESKNRPESIVLLIQKEVSEKILSKVPRGNYWTNAILGYDAKLIEIVRSEEFYPAPKVDSASIVMSKNIDDEKLVLSIGFFKWSKFLHHAFRTQRKMLNKAFPSEMLTALNINPNLRPQDLTKDNLISMLRFTLEK